MLRKLFDGILIGLGVLTVLILGFICMDGAFHLIRLVCGYRL